MKSMIKLTRAILLVVVVVIINLSCSSDDDQMIQNLITNEEVVEEITIQDLVVVYDENPSNGQLLGTIQTNGTGTLNFSITSQSPVDALQINATTGELSVADETLFDFETNPTITATVALDTAVNTASVTIDLNDLHEVGEYKFGGVIFWINNDNDEGYVCAVSDQTSGAEWGCSGVSILGAYGNTIGTGVTNTLAIETDCSTVGTAADIASNLTLNGYSDWFLPNIPELSEIYLHRGVINITSLANGGGNLSDFYWTSNESSFSSTTRAMFIRFSNGNSDSAPKSLSSGVAVRSVRAWTDN